MTNPAPSRMRRAPKQHKKKGPAKMELISHLTLADFTGCHINGSVLVVIKELDGTEREPVSITAHGDEVTIRLGPA